MTTHADVPAVDVRDLTVVLDEHVILDSLSFSVPQGQTTAIIGPNGAGKSVLLKALLRLVPIQQGDVHILGQPQNRYRQVAPLISYIPQRLEIDHTFPLTVRDLFSLKSSRPIGMNEDELSRMHALLTLVGMPDRKEQRLNTLSGGQLQRVLLAYSLMDYPQILFLDEPSAGIDAQGQETIYALLKRIQEQTQLTMILVSHELDIVMHYCQQVLCLNKKLLCAGVPQQVLSPELLEKMYGMPIQHFSHSH
jgi:zinc transport system ATP-binding protein